MTACVLDGPGQIGDRKTSVWMPRVKFEELWPGYVHQALPCPQLQESSGSTSPVWERTKSLADSPLLLEDYLAPLQDDYSFVYETDLRFNMKSPSLFNECTDNKTDSQQVDLQSPTLSTADSNDGLPIGDDSWSLLKEFETISESKMETPLHNCLTPPTTNIMNGNLILEESQDDFEESQDDFAESQDDFADLPDFAQLDALLTLDNDEMLSVSNSASGLPPVALSDKLPISDASTSDLLAELISHTFSTEPSLEGLLSCTTLDIRSVFGESAKTELNLEIPNDNSTSATPESSQEVPEMKIKPAMKTRKRSVTSDEMQSATHVEGSKIAISLDQLKEKRQKRTGEEKYNEMRLKNNIASKRSRAIRRQKFQSLEEQATELEEDNKRLREKADLLEKTVKNLKELLFNHVLILKK